jgi:thiol:disulfide interchange protein
VELKLTAIPEEGYHVYQAAIDDSENATNFVLTQLGGLTAAMPQPSSKPVTKELADGVSQVTYHQGRVTWTIPLQVPDDAKVGQRTIAGAVKYQACTDTSCRLEQAFEFVGTLDVATEASRAAAPLAFSKARVAETLDLTASTQWVTAPRIQDSENRSSLIVILAMALVGGLILNVMPCVLPVVGLKLMSLVETSGEDHGKVFSHNAWYSLGLLSVFWALAAVAIGVRMASGDNFGWGEQFTFWQFRLALTVLVFVMALSFLGVWEIPLPGFAAGKGSQELQQQEGPLGAFSKGVFTTLLATPCSGPLLGVVFGFTIALPPWIILLIYSTVGFGMALPFILIGLIPPLVYWLPKPGPWMDLVKQLMGFLLLGTVAFLFSGFSNELRVPVFVVLIAAWFGCWWIGRVPAWKPIGQRLVAWGGGISTAVLIGIVAFRWGGEGAEKLDWVPYSEQRLAQLQAEGRTVMVDFTANWCINCQVNYHRALNTDETAEVIEELDAVPMLADWTDRNDAIGRKLTELRSNSIPVLAIYPAGNPEQPIVLRDLVNQSQVTAALREAGPSGTAAERAQVASR